VEEALDQFCQVKLGLHPSLITEGGEIVPIGSDPDETSTILTASELEINVNLESLLSDMVNFTNK
jgi:hypothetical protein